MRRPPTDTHTQTDRHAHTRVVVVSWREAVPQSDTVFGPNHSSSLLFWVPGKQQQQQQRSMTLTPRGAAACVSSCTPERVYLSLFLSFSLSSCLSITHLLCLSVSLPIWRSPSPSFSLSLSLSHSLHSSTFSGSLSPSISLNPQKCLSFLSPILLSFAPLFSSHPVLAFALGKNSTQYCDYSFQQ